MMCPGEQSRAGKGLGNRQSDEKVSNSHASQHKCLLSAASRNPPWRQSMTVFLAKQGLSGEIRPPLRAWRQSCCLSREWKFAPHESEAVEALCGLVHRAHRGAVHGAVTDD